MNESIEHPEITRLRNRFDQMKRDGLIDLKVWIGASAEGSSPLPTFVELCAEMNEVLDSIDNRDLDVDISDKIK